MAFLLSQTIRDVIIRNSTLDQSAQDILREKETGAPAKNELVNHTIHGITPNGNYFFCTLVYKKEVLLAEYKENTILNLIDAYATTKDYDEQLKLKCEIHNACKEQIEGISLLFSDSEKTYGFVTGHRVKVVQEFEKEPLELDANGLFSNSGYKNLNKYFIFILDHEGKDADEAIKGYLQGDKTDDPINTEVIHAIKYIHTREKPLEDMRWYLSTACNEIQDAGIKTQVQAVYDNLQLLNNDENEEIKYQATVLTLQLLHSQDKEKRKQLLADYTKLASDLYGSKIPALMVVGISLFVLGASLLAFSIITSPAIPVYLIVGSFCTLGGLICAIAGKNNFYSNKNKEKRSTANTLFHLKENEHINNLSEDLIPHEIKDPNKDSTERTWVV
jgi:hypothetical protein